MAGVIHQILEKTGLLPPSTRIHNKSNRTIFLIPIRCVDHSNPRLGGTVVQELARSIPGKCFIRLDPSKYDLRDSSSQIRFLFRAGDTDNLKEFLKDLLNKPFKVEPWERLFLHVDLYQSSHYLEFNDGKVIGGDDAGLLGTTATAEAPTTMADAPMAEAPITMAEPTTMADVLMAEAPTTMGEAPTTTADAPIAEAPITMAEVPTTMADAPIAEAPTTMAEAPTMAGAPTTKSTASLTKSTANFCEILYLALSDPKRRRIYLNFRVDLGQFPEDTQEGVPKDDPSLTNPRSQMSGAGSCLLSALVFYHDTMVRLRNLNSKFLVADDDEGTVTPGSDGSAVNAWWSVERFSYSAFHLKSGSGKYLAASCEPSLFGETGREVGLLQSSNFPDPSLEWDSVRVGKHYMLRTRYDSFLDGGPSPWCNSFTHVDARHAATSDWVLWHVDILNKGEFALKHDEEMRGSWVTESLPRDSVLIQGGDSVGFDCRMKQLIQLLLEDDSGTKDVLVTGRRGSGKTTLVRKVCEVVRSRERYNAIAWISVPETYDPELIRQELLVQLLPEIGVLPETGVPVTGHYSASFMHYLIRNFPVLASEQRTTRLFVVDNIVNKGTWEILQEFLPIFKTGRVVFIAREMGPNHGYGCEFRTYKLEDLSEEESWALFHSKTFPEGDVPSPFKEVRQDIVRNCEGLPEAIILFSRLLCNNKKDRTQEWESIIRSFDLSHKLDIIKQVLKIIYENDRLGSCLLYLSIFPENCPINCMRASRLWAAEGLLGNRCYDNVAAAKIFLQELLRRGCIHPVETRSDRGLSTFRVDNLVREIIVSLLEHRNLLWITSEGRTRWPEKIRYVSVQGVAKNLNEENLSQLCSVFVFDVSSNKDKTTMSEALSLETSENLKIPFNFKRLNVLDYTGAPLQVAPEALFELTLLSYLSLRDSSIEVIPYSIANLEHLEFLDLKHSLVTELPAGVQRLKRIRHILIYHHKKDPLTENYNLIGFKAFCSVGGLECLEKLCFVESDDSILKDLGNLTKLKRLGITKLRAKQCELLRSSLEELKSLDSLNVHALDKDEIINLHDLSSPPKLLKHLYLHVRLMKLPDWISSLNNLTKIILRWSQLDEDLLATLGKLPNLVDMELRQAYDGSQLDFENGHFRKLKILLLEELEGLRSISLEQGTLPSLENLTISRCQWLERIPSGIEHIRKIRKLTFFDMSHEFYEKVREDLEKDDYQIFRDIPEVSFTRWRAGHWETHEMDRNDEEMGSTDEEVDSNDEQRESADEEVESTDGTRLEDFNLFK